MRRHFAALLAVIAVSLVSVSAQCGTPCEPVKWPLPTWPPMTSPTPFIPDNNANPAPTSAATATPAVTSTPGLDIGGVGDAVSTLGGLMSGTIPAPLNASGTLVTLDEVVATASADTDDFWGYTKGISESDFLGPFSPLGVLLMSFVFALILLKSGTFLLPFAFAILGMLRKVIQLALDFLPF